MRVLLILFGFLTSFSLPSFSEQNTLSEEIVSPGVTVEPSPVQAESVDLKDVVEEGKLDPALDSSPNAEEVPKKVDGDAIVSDGKVGPEPRLQTKESEEAAIASEVTLDEETLVVEESPVPGVQITKVPMLSPENDEKEEANSDLVLLNSVVSPGTAARLSWKQGSSFSGISSPTPVLVVNGSRAGPRLCLTAAVHGDELNGIEIVRHILYNLNPEKLAGSVIGVPIVNLQGFRRSSRYLSDRRDLNRYFPGYSAGSSAARMAHAFFTEVVLHCDFLVDLHTGSFRRTNMPQLRADLSNPDVKNLAERMGAIVVLQSQGHPGSLRRAATEAGIPAVTIELGQPMQLQKDVIQHGIKSVDNLIDSLGMEKRLGFFSIKSEPVYYQSRWVRATQGGILFSEVELGDRISKGALLGVVTDPITNARHEITAPFSGRIIGMALNQVMYPGFAAYHIGLQASAEEVVEEGMPEGPEIEDGDEVNEYSEDLNLKQDPDPRSSEDS